MTIIVNGIVAAIKEGSSFDFAAENRLFSGADSYTLSITFPLKDCENNIRIFGRINRPDVFVSSETYKCEIRDKNFVRSGILTIVEKNESELKAQFLEGRSNQNYNESLSGIYISDLDIGSFPSSSPSSISTTEAWNSENEFIALPWVNDASGNIQNLAEYSFGSNKYAWSKDLRGLSWQIYLLALTKRIAAAIGYDYDFTAWEESQQFKFLLCCNSIPYAWDVSDLNRILPRWTVEEYFSKLELLLNAEFDFDYSAAKIGMRFTENVLRNTNEVKIDSVVNEHQATFKNTSEQVEYRECKNLAYKDCSHNMWKFYSCSWFVEEWKNKSWMYKQYDTLSDMIADNKGFALSTRLVARNSNLNKLLYAADIDTYFVLHAVQGYGNRTLANGESVHEKYKLVLQPVNEFGERKLVDDEKADTDEIDFVPVCVDYTNDDYMFCMFLSMNSYSESDGGSAINTEVGSRPGNSGYGSSSFEEASDSYAAMRIADGEEGKRSEYYDVINVGFWDGLMPFFGEGLPHPSVSRIAINDTWTQYKVSPLPLRINDRVADGRRRVHKINPYQKYTFKFVSSEFPDVRSVFNIKGKKFVCEKITATFSQFGMSEMLTGSFYPLVDD